MNKILGLSLVAALAVTPLALEAQTAGADRGMHGAAAELILGQRAELGLSAEQVRRIEAIRDRLRAQNAPLMEQLHASGAMAGGEHAAGMQGRTAEQRQQMRERMQSMTPEQRAEMRQRMQAQRGEMQAERREGMRRGEGQRGAMTAEQRQQMRERMQSMTPEQRAQMREQMQTRRAQGAGERGMHGVREVPEELRPVLRQMRANQQTARQEIQAVLTAEQQSRLRELVQQRRGPAADRSRPAPAHRSRR